MPKAVLRYFVLAYGRSGSTLLANYLDSHPGLVCYPEPFNQGLWKDMVGYYGSLPNIIRSLYEYQRIDENKRIRAIAQGPRSFKKTARLTTEKNQESVNKKAG